MKPEVGNKSTHNAMPLEIVKQDEKPRNVENANPLGVTKPAEKPKTEAPAEPEIICVDEPTQEIITVES